MRPSLADREWPRGAAGYQGAEPLAGSRASSWIDGVWLAAKGYSDGIQKDGFQPFREIMDSFVANAGEIWACGTCAKPRGITEAHLIAGAKIVTAPMVAEEMAKGASTLGF